VAVRTAMLLGAVVPDLRGETEALATDLGELVRLKQANAADSHALKGEVADLTGEQERLAALTAARQEQLAQAQQGITSERERAAELAAQARSLRELIERMEREIAAAQRKAAESKRAPETRERFAAAAFRDPARLAPKIPFSEARGLVPLPVGGDVVRAFGAPDGYGGTTRGISITTRPKAVVSSPADGWVVFAGPFRSFGRLLIINAGSGYYLLLAGMDHISVEVGQFVLAGEPVATMGEASSVSPAAGAIETNDPVLYVEFRKDGGSIDPGPWWARSQSEKVRG
jgi:septal ring factor EnvC (AmiA/AmiB activator)